MKIRRFGSEPLAIGRIALAVEYNGSAYNGWQAQKNPVVKTVQSCLEKALSFVADHPVKVHCAGRTDSGVHASNQIVHFETNVVRSEKAWTFGANSNLPMDIAVNWAAAVPDDFHARFSATARTYRYLICNSAVKPALAYSQLTWVKPQLDSDVMHQEAQCLVGKHDFSSFRGAGCQANTPFRDVKKIDCISVGNLVIIEITANAFLLHMVRNIAGVLIAVGSGESERGWTREVLEGRDRKLGSVTAHPDGLYLVSVSYPDSFGLPVMEKGPYFCPALEL